jgi:predicted amino acid dehydrogenase
LVDINENNLMSLYDELTATIAEKHAASRITKSKDLSHVCECDGVIVVTNAIKAIVDSNHLKHGAVVIDCAQPKNVSAVVSQLRKDVLVIESAIVHIPGMQCAFDLDVYPEEALGCMTESMLLSTLDTAKWALGKVTKEEMKDIYNMASNMNIHLAYFRNSTGFINEQTMLINQHKRNS